MKKQMSNLIDKHNISIQVGTVVGVILFIIYTTISLMTIKADIDQRLTTATNQYNHCLKWYEALDEEQVDAKITNQKQDLVLVEVKTKLANIEAMLLDIKKTLTK